jgi:transposase
MLTLSPNTKIFIATERVDMRRSIDGLSILVQEILHQDALSDHLFVFVNKRGDKLKVLYWDRNGFCIWYKRLEKSVFRIPKIFGSVFCINPTELGMILEGIDLMHQRRLESVNAHVVN